MCADKNTKDKYGKVYLVGGGPGDTGLMTLRGAQLLEEADVVVHDRLIGEDMIRMIPERAEKINVGKYAGNHPFPQEKISAILVEEAKKGRMVVRLKGGDPFVFGRGGEEIELLVSEGIDFEVIPGITSALAASAYAGIPVTHRDFCSSLHFITGHAQAGRPLEIDFNALSELDGTLVFFMSVSTAGMIADGLLGTGMDPKTPTAIIENGTRSNQRVFTQPLDELGDAVEKHEIISPALIMVGRVCSLSEEFAWFEKLPLKGKHFLVTRPEEGASRLADGLRRLGAKATVRPAIRTSPIRPLKLPVDATAGDKSASESTGAGFDTVVFTSAAGVNSFCDWLLEEGMDMRWFAGKRIACIGIATAKALRKFGLAADFVPTIYSGQMLGEEMISTGFVNGDSKVLLLRTDMASEDVTDVLRKAGVAFADIPVYRTELIEYVDIDAEDMEPVDVITFTSKSCVEGYVQNRGSAGVRASEDGGSAEEGLTAEDGTGAIALCIGEKTAQAAREQGFDVVVSDEATIDSMLEKAVEMVDDK